MLSTLLFTTLSGLALVSGQSSTTPVTGKLGDAQVITNNPLGVAYTATLPGTSVQGSVSGVATANGTGVQFTVSFSNFPSEGGPFLYHIHDQPVPADGNCTGTLAHLDPFQRGEDPPCDASEPERCQVGDLSGKYGKITTSPFTASYVDNYASTVTGIGAFFGNRSVTLHFANKTRLTCASFTMGGASSTAGTGSGNSVSNSTGYTNYQGQSNSSVVPFLGAGNANSVSLTALVAALGLAASFAVML